MRINPPCTQKWLSRVIQLALFICIVIEMSRQKKRTFASHILKVNGNFGVNFSRKTGGYYIERDRERPCDFAFGFLSFPESLLFAFDHLSFESSIFSNDSISFASLRTSSSFCSRN